MTGIIAYGLWQDGVMVASVEAATWEDAYREIDHYALMYAQDGPVTIRRIDPETMEPLTP